MAWDKDRQVASIHVMDALVEAALAYYAVASKENLALFQAAKGAMKAIVEPYFTQPDAPQAAQEANT